MRYSDAYNLKKTNIEKDKIKFTSIKTGEALTVPLNEYSQAILDKYKDVPLPGNKALPVISNQKMNDYLKDLGELCELNDFENVVYYVGN